MHLFPLFDKKEDRCFIYTFEKDSKHEFCCSSFSSNQCEELQVANVSVIDKVLHFLTTNITGSEKIHPNMSTGSMWVWIFIDSPFFEFSLQKCSLCWIRYNAVWWVSTNFSRLLVDMIRVFGLQSTAVSSHCKMMRAANIQWSSCMKLFGHSQECRLLWENLLLCCHLHFPCCL